MKKAKVFLVFILIFLLNISVYASGSISVSTGSLNVEKGKTATFTINASNSAGLVEILSSDSNIVSVDKSNYFFDTSLGNSQVSVTVTGKNSGSATIRVFLKDVATFDGDELTGTKTVQINVKEPVINTDTGGNTGGNNNPPKQDEPETKIEEPPKMIIEKFAIIGYELEFKEDIYEYSIDVSKKVNKLYVIVEGKNFNVTNDKEVDILNKEFFEVVLTNNNETKKYKINIKREYNDIIDKLDDTNDNYQSSSDGFNYNIIIIIVELILFIAIIITLLCIKKVKNKKTNEELLTTDK